MRMVVVSGRFGFERDKINFPTQHEYKDEALGSCIRDADICRCENHLRKTDGNATHFAEARAVNETIEESWCYWWATRKQKQIAGRKKTLDIPI